MANKPPISFGDKGVSFGGAQQGSKPPPKPKPATPEPPKPPMGQMPVSPSGAKIWGKMTGVKTPSKGVINLPATIKPKETPEPPAPKPAPTPISASGAKQWEIVTGVKSNPVGKKGLKEKLDQAAPKNNTPATPAAKNNTPAAPAAAQSANTPASTPAANGSTPKAANNKSNGQKPASSVATSSNKNSVSSDGSNSNSGPKIPAKAKAPSFSRDKANAARHSKTLLNRALKSYPNQNMDTRGTAGANAGEMTPPGSESATQLGGAEYKTFKTNYLKTHKSGKGLSDDSIRALARYLKSRGKGKALFGQTATPATPPATTDPNAPTG